MKRIPIVGFSKKFKRIKLPAQKAPSRFTSGSERELAAKSAGSLCRPFAGVTDRQLYHTGRAAGLATAAAMGNRRGGTKFAGRTPRRIQAHFSQLPAHPSTARRLRHLDLELLKFFSHQRSPLACLLPHHTSSRARVRSAPGAAARAPL